MTMKPSLQGAGLNLAQPPVANLNAAVFPRAPVTPASGSRFADMPIGVLLDALADRLAARLLAHASTPQHPEHASAQHNPLGTPRAFLDAGRRGDFPTFKRGREVVARWADVLAYIEARKVERTKRSLSGGPAPQPTSPSPAPPSPPSVAPPRPAASAGPPPTADERRREVLRAAKILPKGR